MRQLLEESKLSPNCNEINHKVDIHWDICGAADEFSTLSCLRGTVPVNPLKYGDICLSLDHVQYTVYEAIGYRLCG